MIRRPWESTLAAASCSGLPQLWPASILRAHCAQRFPVPESGCKCDPAVADLLVEPLRSRRYAGSAPRTQNHRQSTISLPFIGKSP